MPPIFNLFKTLDKMKTIEINLYKFDELTPEAQNVAIVKNYDINFRFDWWDVISEHAKECGLNLKSFDIGRGNYCRLEFIYCADETAEKILKNIGEQSDLFRLATDYKKEVSDLVTKYSDGVNTDIVAEDNQYEFDKEVADIEDEFLTELEKEYLSMLIAEDEYLSSDEAIKETLLINEYDFTEDGEIY